MLEMQARVIWVGICTVTYFVWPASITMHLPLAVGREYWHVPLTLLPYAVPTQACGPCKVLTILLALSCNQVAMAEKLLKDQPKRPFGTELNRNTLVLNSRMHLETTTIQHDTQRTFGGCVFSLEVVRCAVSAAQAAFRLAAAAVKLATGDPEEACACAS